jgi:hypothetical protein
MRTKTLLLTAALAVAGIASSKAQVYSVNAVGYVNVTLPPGFSLVSNPLDNKAGNKIADLFKNTGPTIPGGFTIYNFYGGNYHTVQYDDLDQAFGPASEANQALEPGNGVFVRNPSQTTLTTTFVGEVPQGNLSNPLPQGFSIKASQVPQAGNANTLGVPGAAGDKLFKWDKTAKQYVTTQFDDLDNAWSPAPTIDVGEAFFLFKKAAATWTRTFSVNQ